MHSLRSLSRRHIIALSAAVVLSATMSTSALAGAPTYTGLVSCTDELGQTTTFADYFFDPVTHQGLVEFKKVHVASGECATMGSYDTSALTRV